MAFLKRPPQDVRRRMRYGSGFFVALGVAAFAYDVVSAHAALESIMAALVLIALSGMIFWYARE